MDCTEKPKRKIHPKEKANFLSVLTFFYTLRLFKQGYRKDIEEKDLYRVLSDYRSKDLGDQLEREWEKQKCKNKNLSVFRLLWACYGKKYFLIGLTQLIVKTTIIIIQPRALGKLVSYFAPGQSNLTKEDAYYYGAIVIGINFISCIYVHNYHLIVTGLGIQVRTAFCSLIYRKALKLNQSCIGDISIGKIITIITKDVHSFESFIHFANDIWIGIIKTAVICYVIYNRIGLAALAGVGFFFIVLPIQIYFGKWATSLRMEMCKKTDERLQLTQEALSAIKIIKMYTWEMVFQKKILESRKKEISKMHKIYYLKFIVLIIGGLNSKIAFYLLIMTYIWLGNNITAEIVYFVLSCFQILTHTLSVLFPLGITQSAELFASVKRIGRILKANEIQSSLLYNNQHITIKPKIIIDNLCINFKEKQILKNINLNLDMGLTLITGPVGCGKSILLKAILNEYDIVDNGKIIKHGRISYASQEPWLFPSTIKQNILFGELLIENRYQEVIKVCALKYDLDIFSKGDNTLVEDRGINLSKGQQARINLARAVYKDADIYLLDDSLAALDAHVSDYIFTECIMKFLKNKLVILVTHNPKHIRDVDNIVILNHGQVKSFVKPTELSDKELTEDIEYIKINQINNDLDQVEEENSESGNLITETTIERQIYQETQKEGDVDLIVYKKYIRFGGGLLMAIGVFLIFVAAQSVISYTDKLVSQWVNIEQELSNFSIYNNTHLLEYEETLARRDNKLSLYSLMIVITTVLSLTRSLSWLYFARRASIKLHKYVIAKIINATMKFFDTNFIGNILNRFSKDLTTIDETVPFVFYHVFRVLLILCGIIILIATVNAYFLIPAVVFFVILVIIRKGCLPTGRSLKRLDASTKSPIVGHLKATLEGLPTIRASKIQNILIDEFDSHQDLYTSANYIFQCSMRAFAFSLDTLCTFFIAFIVVRFLVSDDDFLAGNVGLAISQTFLLTGTLQWGIRQWAEIENQMTSVERILEYTEVKQENKTGRIIENWPINGKISYQNVSLKYNDSDIVLKNIYFTIEPQEKIGVVGRTGAGKSSIITTLFRLYDIDGKILIDDYDIKTLSLDFLRSKIAIIPQDPVLFEGTIRENIDPLNQYSDQEIWSAIEIANLKKIVKSLDLEIDENGSNFSVGQKQLICMARAIVRNNKIVVLDEATANMDQETDTLIHETINKCFKNCTVITIAHKLNNILNANKIMVLEKGEIIEFDTPTNLLQINNGYFSSMVQKANLTIDKK